jgi:hypothetical protein
MYGLCSKCIYFPIFFIHYEENWGRDDSEYIISTSEF